jgi:hypothetical protein
VAGLILGVLLGAVVGVALTLIVPSLPRPQPAVPPIVVTGEPDNPEMDDLGNGLFYVQKSPKKSPQKAPPKP